MGDWLKTVYSETSSIKLNKHYKKWSSKYDRDMKEWGYAYPSQLKKIIQENLKFNSISASATYPVPQPASKTLIFFLSVKFS